MCVAALCVWSFCICTCMLNTIYVPVSTMFPLSSLSATHTYLPPFPPPFSLLSFPLSSPLPPPTGAISHSFALFGEGVGAIFLDDVGCFGNESRLDQCSHLGVHISNCFHFEDVSVLCPSELFWQEGVGTSLLVEGRGGYFIAC